MYLVLGIRLSLRAFIVPHISALFPPFRFCGSEGLESPEGLCGAGYYCALGATSPVPADEADASVAGLCAAGYACVEV